jgi:hypothetical protein
MAGEIQTLAKCVPRRGYTVASQAGQRRNDPDLVPVPLAFFVAGGEKLRKHVSGLAERFGKECLTAWLSQRGPSAWSDSCGRLSWGSAWSEGCGLPPRLRSERSHPLATNEGVRARPAAGVRMI